MIFNVSLAVLGPQIPDLSIGIGRATDYQVVVFAVGVQRADLHSVPLEAVAD